MALYLYTICLSRAIFVLLFVVMPFPWQPNAKIMSFSYDRTRVHFILLLKYKIIMEHKISCLDLVRICTEWKLEHIWLFYISLNTNFPLKFPTFKRHSRTTGRVASNRLKFVVFQEKRNVSTSLYWGVSGIGTGTLPSSVLCHPFEWPSDTPVSSEGESLSFL